MHAALDTRDQELKTLLDVNIAVARHLKRDDLFGALALCLRNIIETDRFGIELPIDEGTRLQGHLLTPKGTAGEKTRPSVLPSAGTACDWVIQNHHWYVCSSREELRERFPITYEVMTGQGMESLCALSLETGEKSVGALFFMAARPGAYANLRQGLLEQVASAVAVALDACLAHEEVQRLRDKLAAENIYLREEIRREYNFNEIIGNSPPLREVFRNIDLVAPMDSTVLLFGETGTGKELVARAIHNRSARKDRPLVKVNCGAIAANLVESELFGHVKGAFTGAHCNRDGRFKLADGGTIFLDEIGELPAETQVKLLRVLQEQEFEPIGSSTTVRVDVRVIAATNRDLEEAVKAKRFRSDLFYRLNVFPISLPPLRTRPTDIPLLIEYFLGQLNKKLGKNISQISPDSMQRLINYDWPGNVRELQNVIERAAILSDGPVLALPPEFQGSTSKAARGENNDSLAMDEITRKHIEAVLAQTRGVIEGPGGAAKLLNLHPNTLRSRMRKLGVSRTRRVAA
jgi:formate hydrogenlyase transcriptional activator